MGVNNIISGVNWASLKKFARFTFGELEFAKIKKVDSGHKYFIIGIDKKTYNEMFDKVEEFENTFLVEIKPV